MRALPNNKITRCLQLTDIHQATQTYSAAGKEIMAQWVKF
jgi:hypothetical protein